MLSEIFLTPCAIFFNSSGGSVLLISSSILSSYKFMFNSFHLQLECCPNYIILIHSYLVSTRVVSIPSCPLYSSFIALQPPRFIWGSFFLFSTAVLSIVFNSVVFFFQVFNLSRFFGFTLLSKKQLSFTSSLPLPFPSGAILDLGTRSSRSGGVL